MISLLLNYTCYTFCLSVQVFLFSYLFSFDFYVFLDLYYFYSNLYLFLMVLPSTMLFVKSLHSIILLLCLFRCACVFFVRVFGYTLETTIVPCVYSLHTRIWKVPDICYVCTGMLILLFQSYQNHFCLSLLLPLLLFYNQW